VSKPLLRGVFHQWAFFAAFTAGLVLVALADGVRERVASWVYAAALAAMFGMSAIYHRVDWRTPARRAWARRLDHSTIFLFIAGTYTPFALLAFEGASAAALLAAVSTPPGPSSTACAGLTRSRPCSGTTSSSTCS
jgi:hemolysin III